MSTETVRTLKLSHEQENKLFETWHEFESKAPPYARFQLRCENCVITCYESGKTVFQGKDAAVYASAFETAASASESKEKINTACAQLPQAGSDEVGTGDYFGPVCVCAALVEEKDMELIQKYGIRDSKQLNDEEILSAGPELIRSLKHSLLIVNNRKYNEVHRSSNLNEIKAKLHNHAYISLAKKAQLPSLKVIDQFTPEDTYYRYLRFEPKVISGIHFETKAEDRYPAVAAASVIARYAFLKSMEQMEEQYGMTFHKGGGAQADECARKFVEKYGSERLGEVAKLHFKNTERVLKK